MVFPKEKPPESALEPAEGGMSFPPPAVGCGGGGFLQHCPRRPAPQQHPKGIPGEVQAVDGVFRSLRRLGNLEGNLVPWAGCIRYLQKGENAL